MPILPQLARRLTEHWKTVVHPASKERERREKEGNKEERAKQRREEAEERMRQREEKALFFSGRLGGEGEEASAGSPQLGLGHSKSALGSSKRIRLIDDEAKPRLGIDTRPQDCTSHRRRTQEEQWALQEEGQVEHGE